MSRPVDWEPLAPRDPIGGDVGVVSDEARYYRQLESEISDQVARLRRIAAEGDQVGKTADKLRSAAADTAGKLQKTHGRVAAVAEALTSWIPSLEQAQQDSLTALHRARDAESRRHANTPPAGAPAPTTDAEKAADAARADRLDQATADLAAAHRMLADVVAARDRAAQHIADQIHGALHDGLTDGFWDHVSNWVAEHVEAIKVITEVLSWVATALAVIALFIPGLDLIVLAVMAFAFVGHALLAATGNGSWTDAILDVVGMATMGAGKMAESVMKATRALAATRAVDVAGERAAGAVTASRTALRTSMEARTSGFFGKVLHPLMFRSLASGRFDAETAELATTAREAARSSVLTRAEPTPSFLQVIAGGGKETAKLSEDMAGLARGFGDDARFAAINQSFTAARTAHSVSFVAENVLDFGRHVADRSDIPGVQRALPGIPAWNRFKQSTTLPLFGTPAEGEG